MPSRPLSDFADLTETTLSSARMLDGRMIRVNRDQVRLPDGSEAFREYVLHPGAVIIAAFVDDDTLIFEHQFRYAVRRHFIELPAGKIDAGEAHAETARRELLEETGYTALHWHHAATLHAKVLDDGETPLDKAVLARVAIATQHQKMICGYPDGERQ